MSDSSIPAVDKPSLQQIIAPLLGQSPWQVKSGWGSFVNLEFGRVVVVKGIKGDFEHGEWNLWIYMAAWTLEDEHSLLTACEDTRENMQRELSRLEGVVLRSVEFIGPSLETLLHFDQHLTVRLFPTRTEKHNSWLLFVPDGNVLTFSGSGQWSYHPSRTG